MKTFGMILALSLVAVCALVVGGCNGGAPEPPKDATPPMEAPSETPAEPAPAPETPAPAVEPAPAPAPADAAAPAPADAAAPAPADAAAPAATDQAASGAALTDEFDDFDYSAGGGAASKKR